MPTKLRALLPLLVLTAFLVPNNALALEQKATITHVTFHISHPAKKYDAKLLQGGAEVTAHFDPSDISKTSVDATIQVEYFNSDNEMRDSHMLEVLEAIIFPTITWKGTATGISAAPVTAGKHQFLVKGPLTVHGSTQELETMVSMEVADNGLVTVGAEFVITLESFQIERPSLVFVKIANEVPVKVNMTFPAGPGLLTPTPPPTESTTAESKVDEGTSSEITEQKSAPEETAAPESSESD